MYSALILGRSFIRRLRDNANGSWANLGFEPFLSLSGLCRPHITDTIKQIRPAVIVIQIGENGAGRQSSDGSSLTLARDILSVAQWLVDGFSVGHVMMQLMQGVRAATCQWGHITLASTESTGKYERAALVAVTARSGSTKDYEQ